MTNHHSNAPGAAGSLQGYRAMPSPLEMSPAAYRRAARLAAEIAADFYATRGQRPVYTPPSGEALEYLRALVIPEQGSPAEEILALFAQAIMPLDMGNQVETFAGWVNPAAAPISVFLDFLASAMNPTSAKGLHAATEIERLVIRWLDELIGFPTEE